MTTSIGIRLTYDVEDDALVVTFRDDDSAQPRGWRVSDSVRVALDQEGGLVALELLDASWHVDRAVLDALPEAAPQSTQETTMTSDSRAKDEREIRQLIEGWVRAFRAKDVNGVMSIYAPGIVSYDIVPPLAYVGADAYRRPWEEAFASYQGPIAYEVRDPSITVGEGIAFSHSLNRMSGTLTSGESTELWLRWTVCFRQIDGKWLVTHEHVSVPVDLANGRAALGLEPSLAGAQLTPAAG